MENEQAQIRAKAEEILGCISATEEKIRATLSSLDKVEYETMVGASYRKILLLATKSSREGEMAYGSINLRYIEERNGWARSPILDMGFVSRKIERGDHFQTNPHHSSFPQGEWNKNLPALLEECLSKRGMRGWQEIANLTLETVILLEGCFYKTASSMIGRVFDNPAIGVVEEYDRKDREAALLLSIEQERKKNEDSLAAGEKKNRALNEVIESLHQRAREMSAELAEVRRERQTREQIAAAMAGTLAVQSELALANLRLAAQKAVADLAATKGISKSRRFAKIREDLERAINPPLSCL